MDTNDLLRQLARLEREPPEPDSDCLPREVLEAFRAGLLPDPARDAAEQHLAACGRCLDHLLGLNAPERRMSPATRQKVLAATSQARASRKQRAPQWLAAGFATGMVALLVMISVRDTFEPIAPYTFTLGGQVMQTRGSHPEVDELSFEYHPDSDLVLRAYPELGRPNALPSATAYLLHPDGLYHPFQPAPDITIDPETGMIEVRIRAGELLGNRYGRHSVRLLLHDDDTSPPAQMDPHDPDSSRHFLALDSSFEYRPGD